MVSGTKEVIEEADCLFHLNEKKQAFRPDEVSILSM